VRAALLTLVFAAGCNGSNPFGGACTTEFVYGVNVTVLDAVTSAPIVEGATLTIRDAGYVEVVTESYDGQTLSGAGERPGRYTLTVDRAGYQQWVQDGVVVIRGECHVTPAAVEARLTPT
jgi:hypothetical protein